MLRHAFGVLPLIIVNILLASSQCQDLPPDSDGPRRFVAFVDGGGNCCAHQMTMISSFINENFDLSRDELMHTSWFHFSDGTNLSQNDDLCSELAVCAIGGTRSFIREAIAHLNSLEAGTEVFLIGHSWGADSILRLLSDHSPPNHIRIRLLVTIDSVGAYGMRSPKYTVPHYVDYFFNRWQEHDIKSFPLDGGSGEMNCSAKLQCNQEKQYFSYNSKKERYRQKCSWSDLCTGTWSFGNPGYYHKRVSHASLAYDEWVQTQIIQTIKELMSYELPGDKQHGEIMSPSLPPSEYMHILCVIQAFDTSILSLLTNQSILLALTFFPFIFVHDANISGTTIPVSSFPEGNVMMITSRRQANVNGFCSYLLLVGSGHADYGGSPVYSVISEFCDNATRPTDRPKCTFEPSHPSKIEASLIASCRDALVFPSKLPKRRLFDEIVAPKDETGVRLGSFPHRAGMVMLELRRAVNTNGFCILVGMVISGHKDYGGSPQFQILKQVCDGAGTGPMCSFSADHSDDKTIATFKVGSCSEDTVIRSWELIGDDALYDSILVPASSTGTTETNWLIPNRDAMLLATARRQDNSNGFCAYAIHLATGHQDYGGSPTINIINSQCDGTGVSLPKCDFSFVHESHKALASVTMKCDQASSVSLQQYGCASDYGMVDCANTVGRAQCGGGSSSDCGPCLPHLSEVLASSITSNSICCIEDCDSLQRDSCAVPGGQCGDMVPHLSPVIAEGRAINSPGESLTAAPKPTDASSLLQTSSSSVASMCYFVHMLVYPFSLFVYL